MAHPVRNRVIIIVVIVFMLFFLLCLIALIMVMQFEGTPYWTTLKPIIESGAMQAAIDGVYKYPHRINLYTGISCMFSCHFCNRNYDYVVKNSDNVFSQIIDQDNGLDKDRFGVTGGLEPLTSPYIGKICEDLYKKGYRARMVTNGFLLNDKMLSKNPYINSLHHIRVSVYGIHEDETESTTKHAKAHRIVKQNLKDYNMRPDRTSLHLNYVLLPGRVDKLIDIFNYIEDIGGVETLSLREDHSFRYNITDRKRLQDILMQFDERAKSEKRFIVDYGYGLQNAMCGIESPITEVFHHELIPTQSPQVKVCVDPRGDIFSYMDAGFTGRPGHMRHCLGNVTGSSIEEQLKKMIRIEPEVDDPTFMDAFNHLIHKYIYLNSK